MCSAGGMGIRSLQDLQVYQDSLDAAEAVSALLRRDGLRRDFHLRGQLAKASDEIASHIGEGFGQQTDRHFAHYLGIARGSCNEICTHLAIARGREYLTKAECDEVCARYVRIGKRLTRLMQHLRMEDRKRRG
ncbi:MAG: four helix bundle protein [Luteitalea sp.]|nr:four helix bundle protein [Luteitalea sp.]